MKDKKTEAESTEKDEKADTKKEEPSVSEVSEVSEPKDVPPTKEEVVTETKITNP